MKKHLITLCIVLCIKNYGFAQNSIGAKLMAMGNQNAAVKDDWNFTGNFVNDTQIGNPILAIGYSKYFYGGELSDQNFKLILPLKKYEAGLSFQRYGISEFNQINAGASLAKNFGDKFSIGLRANFHQLKIQNYGSSTGFSVDAGMVYQINNQLTIGINVNNASKQTYQNTNVAIRIPSTIHLGAAYQASSKVLMATTITKNFNEKFDVGLGLDYKLIALLSLRGGITMKPFKQYGGVGIDYKKFKIDLAVGSDPYLGYSSQMGLAYAF